MMRPIFTGLFFWCFGSSLVASTSLVSEGYFVKDPMNRSGFHSPLLESFILDKSLTIDHVSPEGFEIFGPEGLGNRLSKMGLEASVSSPFLKPQDTLSSANVSEIVSDYKTPEDFAETFEKLSQEFPGLVRVSTIGLSRQGRSIQLIRLGAETALHKVFLGGNIHGNEITGRELLGQWVEDLSEGYRLKEPRIVKLLDAVEVFVVPSINPDGVAMVRRGNAANVDLNRNFPDNSSGDPNSLLGKEPEVQALMTLFKENKFQLSVSFHGGAQVVNYPWDNTRDDYPQLEWVQALSRDYVVQSQKYMESSQFPDGTVRGYDWYPTYGNFQDWSCHYHGSHHVQIELSDLKWPRYSDQQLFYELNRESLISFVESVLTAP